MFFRDAKKTARYKAEKASSADELAAQSGAVEPKGPPASLVDAAIPVMPKAHRYAAIALAISPDAKTLISAGEDGTKLWTLPEGELWATLPEATGSVKAVAISQDGKWLAAGVHAIRPEHKSSVRIWSLPSLKLHATLTGFGNTEYERPQLDVAFGPGGQLAVGELRGTTTLWKWPEGEWQAEPSDKVNTWKSAFSSDGMTLTVLSFEAGVSIWNLPDGTRRASIPGLTSFDILGGVAFGQDGKMLAAADQFENSVSIFTLPDGKPLAKLSGHTKLVNAIAFAPEGRRLATGSRDNTINIWELPEGKLITTLKAPGTALFGIKQVAFTPDGKIIIAADDDGCLYLWELGQPGRCAVLFDQDLQTKK
jgi:WD40 repeat protein